MSDASQRLCPDCKEGIVPHCRPGWAWCQCCGWVGPRSECHFAVDLDAKPEAPQPAPEAPPQAPQAKRVRTSAAHVDIDNAFIAWFNATGWDNLEASEADNRVKVWLAQVAADQRQLHAALLACQAVAEAKDDLEVIRAKRMAKDVIGSYGEQGGMYSL